MVSYRQVVRVWRTNMTAPDSYLGTAFLISPGHLLTAKHVVEGVPTRELILKTNLGSWYGGGDRGVRECRLHPEYDAAILVLEKIAVHAEIISIASEQDATLESEMSVKLIGYSTETADQEAPQVCISGYDGKYNLEMTHTAIAKGMSGGPVLHQEKLVAITRAKDSEHSFLLPINSIRQFIQPFVDARGTFADMLPIDLHDLDELKTILRGFSSEEAELVNWCSIILPDSFRPIGNHLVDYLDFFAQKKHNVDQAPLFEFIHMIKSKVGENVRVLLEEWEIDCCHRMGFETQSISARITKKIKSYNKNQINNRVLLIKVEPENKISDTVFLLDGWVQVQGNFEPLPMPSRKCSKAEIEELLPEIVYRQRT